MPTYEYECKACGEVFDVFQKMSDSPLKKCACCNKGPVRRRIGTGAGIIFKGSGFYCTDYRKDTYKKAEKAEKGDKAEPKSDTKTEAKKSEKKAEKT